MTYEELQVGTVYGTDTAVFSKEGIIHFSRQYDPQYLHLDEEKATAGQFGGIIASGLQTLSVACRLWVDQHVVGDDIVGGIGFNAVRFRSPVYPGDEVRVSVTIASKRLHPRKPQQGIVSLKLQAMNQENQVVMEATLIALVKRQTA